jgi:hypothetical protein
MSYFAPLWVTLHPLATLHTAELYVALYWANMHPFFSYVAPSELRCTPLSCAAFYWATLHPNGLSHLHTATCLATAPCWAIPPAPCTLLSYASPSWTTLNLLSNSVPSWATGRSTELRCTLLSYVAPTELHCNLLSYAAPCWATLHPLWTSSSFELRYTQLCYVCTQLNYAVPNWATQHAGSYAAP